MYTDVCVYILLQRFNGKGSLIFCYLSRYLFLYGTFFRHFATKDRKQDNSIFARIEFIVSDVL